ncbi:glycoside hydrolase family 43 protein [Wocania arenilitoris]|nr:glycoside hydrolase family 43 protein [Wocania arenilitoris]
MVKRHFLIILVSLMLLGCTHTESEVYLFSFFKGNGEDGLHIAASMDGFNWKELNNGNSFLKPKVGNDKLMRDPCIIKGGDDKFHMVWTVSWNEKGIGYANSEDLINWSEQKYIPVMHHEANARNCWAPELFFDEDSKEYFIFWATTIPGRFKETDSFGDNGYNHRMYYTKTKDFIEFADTKLFYNKGFNVIDSNIQKDEDGYIMFLKDETLLPKAQKNIRIATSKELSGNFSEASEPISPNWVEGPTSIKINDEWIVYFDMYTKHQMGAIKSSNLIDWEDISDKVSFPKGTRHGTVFKVKESIFNNLTKSDTLKF